jgi:hypothetical protein
MLDHASKEMRIPVQIAGLLGLTLLITLATALSSHLIGTGRGVPSALIDELRLGPRGQFVVELGYSVAAGLATGAVVAAFVLLPNIAGRGHRIPGGVRIAIAIAVVMGCFLGPDFALGGSALGAYTTRGAYSFVSAPGLHPPIVRADIREPGSLAKGYIFTADFYDPSVPGTMVGQSGPLILDQRLSPVWFQPVPENMIAGNLSLQTYEGQPVLAWWQGVVNGDGATTSGEYVVVDQHYRTVARLRGTGGWVLDLHEIAIRGANAWVTANKSVHVNLSRYGGARNGMLIDSAVQEYNLETGKLLRSWDALHHIPLTESETPVPRNGSLWDPYHLNSIELPGDGSFVISMRNTWAAYKVRIATGRIDWSLGGKQSSFSFGPGAAFQWQHDVTIYPGTPLATVFDDHCCQTTPAGNAIASAPSRGLVLKLNPTAHTATLVSQFTHGADSDSEFMGNIEPLPDGNEFVGWGSLGSFSEYNASGRMLLDAALPRPDVTYRATVEPWVGLPLYPPSGAARQLRGRTIVYASWNGATEVASWRVLAGPSSAALVPAITAPKSGFETSIEIPSGRRVFRIQALDARGRVLGTSAPFTFADTISSRAQLR